MKDEERLTRKILIQRQSGLSIRDEPPPRLATLPTPEGTIVALTYAQHLVED
jgi:hypothetical protein